MDVDDLLWDALVEPKIYSRWAKLLNTLADIGQVLYVRKYENWDGSRNNFVGPSSSWDKIERFLSENDLSIDQLTYEVYNSLRDNASSYLEFAQQFFSWEAVGLLKYFKSHHPDQSIQHCYIEITDVIKKIEDLDTLNPYFRIESKIRYNFQGDSVDRSEEVSMPWGSDSFNLYGRNSFINWAMDNLKRDGKFEVDEFD